MREKISKLIDFLPLPHYNYWLLYFFSFLEHCVFFNVINVYVPDTPSRKTRYSCLVLGPLFLSVSPHLKKNLLTAIFDSTNEQKVPWCENLGYLVKKIKATFLFF